MLISLSLNTKRAEEGPAARLHDRNSGTPLCSRLLAPGKLGFLRLDMDKAARGARMQTGELSPLGVRTERRPPDSGALPRTPRGTTPPGKRVVASDWSCHVHGGGEGTRGAVTGEEGNRTGGTGGGGAPSRGLTRRGTPVGARSFPSPPDGVTSRRAPWAHSASP